MTMNNYYFMYRGWSKNEVFNQDEPFTEREVWCWMIENTSWKDRMFRVGNQTIKLKRGQLTASIRYLMEAWKWTNHHTRAYLKILSDFGMISLEKQTGQSVITICNYEKYQPTSNKNHSDFTQNPHEYHTVSTSVPHKTEEGIERKEGKNILLSSSVSGDASIKPRKRKSNVKTAIPDGCVPITDTFRAYAVKQDHSNPEAEWENFTDHCRANDKRFSDWDAAGRTWIRNSFKFGRTANNNFSGRKNKNSADSFMEGARMALAEEDSGIPTIF